MSSSPGNSVSENIKVLPPSSPEAVLIEPFNVSESTGRTDRGTLSHYGSASKLTLFSVWGAVGGGALLTLESEQTVTNTTEVVDYPLTT